MQVRLTYMGKTGDLIRDARERARLSQQELADLVEVSRTTISNWENGTPPRSSLGKIREVLGLDEHLRPVGQSDRQDFASMNNPEFVARLNVLTSQLNAAVAEAVRRLSSSEDNTTNQHTGDTGSNRTVTGRVVMDVQDDEFSGLEGGGGESVTGN